MKILNLVYFNVYKVFYLVYSIDYRKAGGVARMVVNMIIKEQKLFNGEIIGMDFETITFNKVPAVTVATIMINNGYPVLERAHIINAINEMKTGERYCFYFPNAYMECNVYTM